ncbi:MAG: GntR family transcriptional regulator [Bacteroidales bacterium]
MAKTPRLTTKVRQLADLIAHSISAGEFQKGEFLPSINVLSAQYEVSRDTVFKAFLELRERGFIAAVHGKGYYVTEQITNVLLLLDEFSPFKDDLFNSFTKRLSANHKVDLLFHQYNEKLFRSIIRESLGRYSKYVVMNFHNELFSDILNQIDPEQLLLLDFGNFEKGNISHIMQDFDQGFYFGMFQAREQFRKYKKLILVFPDSSKHPQTTKAYFGQFCTDFEYEYEIISTVEHRMIQSGEAYIVINTPDLVEIVKRARLFGARFGEDIGLMAYNDMPAYEVIDNGITSLSVDFCEMGRMAADFVLEDKPVQIILPTELRLRGSL